MNIKTVVAMGVIIMFLILAADASGKIYKWMDQDGKSHFSSSPPTHGSAEIVQPKPNVYTSRRLPAPDKRQITKKRKSVVMYSAVWCGICKTARSYFKKNRILFSEYDIETSAKGRRDYKKLKGSGVPIILVGKKRMNGFRPKSFQAVYDG